MIITNGLTFSRPQWKGHLQEVVSYNSQWGRALTHDGRQGPTNIWLSIVLFSQPQLLQFDRAPRIGDHICLMAYGQPDALSNGDTTHRYLGRWFSWEWECRLRRVNDTIESWFAWRGVEISFEGTWRYSQDIHPWAFSRQGGITFQAPTTENSVVDRQTVNGNEYVVTLGVRPLGEDYFTGMALRGGLSYSRPRGYLVPMDAGGLENPLCGAPPYPTSLVPSP